MGREARQLFQPRRGHPLRSLSLSLSLCLSSLLQSKANFFIEFGSKKGVSFFFTSHEFSLFILFLWSFAGLYTQSVLPRNRFRYHRQIRTANNATRSLLVVVVEVEVRKKRKIQFVGGGEFTERGREHIPPSSRTETTAVTNLGSAGVCSSLAPLVGYLRFSPPADLE